MGKIEAFSYAMPGAMGAPGEIILIDSELKVIETNISSIEKETDDQSLIKIINSSEQRVLGGDDSIDDWRSAYLGMGNFLFVRDDYFEDFKSLSTKKGIKTPYELYRNWMNLIKEILKEHKQWK